MTTFAPSRRPPPAVHINYVRHLNRALGHFETPPIVAIRVTEEFAKALLREADQTDALVIDPHAVGRFEIAGIKIEVEAG